MYRYVDEDQTTIQPMMNWDEMIATIIILLVFAAAILIAVWWVVAGLVQG